MKIFLLIILLIIYVIIYNKNSIYFKRKNTNKNSTEVLFNIANITENITTENGTNEITTNIKENKKRIGVIGADHGQNIGNNLLKYAMFIKLKEFGFDPYIVGYLRPGNNISFLEKIINIKYINKSFKKEIKKNDYDILMVNSDQVWRKTNLNYKDVGFLEFAKHWNITKFIYGASLGINKWLFFRFENTYLKTLLKSFTGISVREKGLIDLVKKNLGFEPELVVDPTLLIKKEYYLDLIKDYKNELKPEDKFIFKYEIDKIKNMKLFIKKASEKLNYKIYNCSMKDKDYIQRFIYGIYNSMGVVTNSFHGVIFSLIFNKPFVAFNLKSRGNERFNTLRDVYGLGSRIFDIYETPDISLISTPLEINRTKIDELVNKSIVFLKKNLNIS